MHEFLSQNAAFSTDTPAEVFTTTVTMPRALRNAIKVRAKKDDRSVSATIRIAVERYLKNQADRSTAKSKPGRNITA